MKTVEFKVDIGETADGRFVAYSEHEPVFCIVCDGEDEALEVARSAISDYARRFLRGRPIGELQPLPELPVWTIAQRKTYVAEEAA